MSASTRTKRPVGPPSRPQWAIDWSQSTSRRSSGPNETPLGLRDRYRSVSARSNSTLQLPPTSSYTEDSGFDDEPQSLSDAQARPSSVSHARDEESDLPSPRATLYSPEPSVLEWKQESGTNRDRGYRRQPRFEPSRVHEAMLQKESIRPPVFGGRSKNQQLGSVAESWGAGPTLEIPKGMFELEDDPPSPTSGKNMTPQEIQAEKARRAALGIPAEKSGRPSIKDMEKERLDKLKKQQLDRERVKNGFHLSELQEAVEEIQPSSCPPTSIEQPVSAHPPVAMPLSERLRLRDLEDAKEGDAASDGW